MAQSVQGGSFLYAAAGGSANALTAALVPAPAALQAGMTVCVKATATNTGPATLNVSTLGAAAITAGGVALKAGMLLSGQIYAFVYDGTSWQMQCPTLSGIVAYSYGTNGYEVYSNGKIEQWGELIVTTNAETTVSVTFPTPFLNNLWHVIAGTTIFSADSLANNMAQNIRSSWSLSGCSFYLQLIATSAAGAMYSVPWRAIGN
jgi:hypothetical protein